MRASSFLYIPLCGTGSGVGHCTRALSFASHCVANRLHADILIENPRDEPFNQMRESYSAVLSSKYVRVITTVASERDVYDAVIFDTRELSVAQLRKYVNQGLCVGVDIGGTARKHMTYLVDTLPVAGITHAPNSMAWGSSVDGSIPTRQSPARCRRVLLYEPAGFERECESAADMIASCGAVCDIAGGTYSFESQLSHRLHAYDCVITHFGLMALEACYANIPVVTVGISAYHNRLAKHAGFAHRCKTYKHAARLVCKCVHDDNAFARFVSFAIPPNFTKAYVKPAAPLHEIIFSAADALRATYKNNQSVTHPFADIHEHNRNTTNTPRKGYAVLDAAVWRDERKTVFRRGSKKLWYQMPFALPVSYEQSYFSEEYKNQYGRTYIQDIPSIKKTMRARLNIIEQCIARRAIDSGAAPRLVDIGCAFGAMVSVARERGYEAMGVDVSGEACHYVRDIVGVPAIQADISDSSFADDYAACAGRTENDIVTCWYVLEHAPNFITALHHVRALLRRGGIFALSVPNAAGISARKNQRVFFRDNPIDHFSIFSPRALSRLLRKNGLVARAVRVTGHHPERFFTHKKSVCMLWCAGVISRACKLGDTFELYAEKL